MVILCVHVYEHTRQHSVNTYLEEICYGAFTWGRNSYARNWGLGGHLQRGKQSKEDSNNEVTMQSNFGVRPQCPQTIKSTLRYVSFMPRALSPAHWPCLYMCLVCTRFTLHKCTPLVVGSNQTIKCTVKSIHACTSKQDCQDKSL